MRTLTLAALLLLSACGFPFKYQTFRNPKGEADVMWILWHGQLHRCWQHPSGGPVCMPVAVPVNPAGPVRAAETLATMNDKAAITGKPSPAAGEVEPPPADTSAAEPKTPAKATGPAR